jgi:hypothetical protein
MRCHLPFLIRVVIFNPSAIHSKVFAVARRAVV